MKKLLSLLTLAASSSLVLAGCYGGRCGTPVYAAPVCSSCPTEVATDACPGACPTTDTAVYEDACPGGCPVDTAVTQDAVGADANGGGCPTGLATQPAPVAATTKAEPASVTKAATPAATTKTTPKTPVKEEELEMDITDDMGDESALAELESSETEDANDYEDIY